MSVFVVAEVGRGGHPGPPPPPPPAPRFVTWALAPEADPASVLRRAAELELHEDVVVGLGAALEGVMPFPTDLPLFPATQGALWARFSAPEAGRRFDDAAALAAAFAGELVVVEEVESFMYRGGRDLSGFEDGTENPHDARARAAAVIADAGPGRDGGSYVAVQRWVHDLAVVARMTTAARDAMVGRSRETNEELADAPPSAHVKRTAQESFTPEAFMVRRSMPYGGLREHGLYFVAFVESLDRFDRMLRRMAGVEDGIVDGLFAYSRPVTGGYYFCPPVRGRRLDLRSVG
jgi:putative iron-dependent peroxidase